MADVSKGPVSSMPMSAHELPAGATCDTHHPRPAVKRVQGETDSFGCEYLDLCQQCVDELKAEQKRQRSTPQFCDWCKQEKLGVRPHRDLDEGSAGPLYDVCSECIQKENERARQELEESGFYDSGWNEE